MKLKRLIIQGFKSFKDKTIINFDEGITGIVGPNGCGKSNIVDALFWVMGEQSAKHLRGTSMQDLIFAGSSKYQPATSAEVTLVIENTNGKHVNILNTVSRPAEIQLTRKLYRNGETEYRINGEPARLRDIHEVFMDTGAGAKSYSIIAQGEINKLVQAKPEERRTMIEEVAGITKFKLRRRESLKKLEQTELNLGRLTDLKNEVYKTLKSLEKQAEKAERARVLREKVKKHELIVNSHREFDLLQDYKDNREMLSTKRNNISDWTNQRNILENDLEEERFKKTEMMERVENTQEQYNKASKELVAAEEKLKFLNKSLDDKENQIEVRIKESEELKLDIENRSNKAEELKLELQKIELTNSENLDFEALEEKLEILKEELSFRESSLLDVQRELSVEKNNLNVLEQTTFKNRSKLEESIKSLEDINQEIEVIEKQYSAMTQEMVREKEDVQTLNKEIEELKNQIEILKLNSEKLAQDYKAYDQESRIISKDLISTESKLASLKELALNLDGFGAGAKNFIEESSYQESFTLFGSLIECDAQYAKAIQNLFADFFQSLVSKNGSFDEVSQWLNNNNEGALQLLKLSTDTAVYESETIERLKIYGCEEIIPVSELITINNGDYAQNLSNLFKGFYLVSNLNPEIVNQLPLGMDFRGLASFDGRLAAIKKSNSLVTNIFPLQDMSQGVVERNNLIKELEANFDTLTIKNQEIEKKVSETKATLDDAYARLAILNSDLLEKQTKYSTRKTSIDLKIQNFESDNSRLGILKNRKNDISKTRLEMMESEESLLQEEKVLKEKVISIESKLALLQDELILQRETYQNEKDDLTTKIVEAKTFEERKRNMENQIADVVSQIERNNQKLEINGNLLQETEVEIETINAEIATLTDSNQEMASTLSDQEGTLNQMKDDLSELLFSMKEREDEVRELTTKINKTEKELVDVEVKLGSIINEEEQIVKNIFEKYQIDLRHTLKSYMSYVEEDIEGLHDLSSMYFMETEEGSKEINREVYSFDRRYGQALKESAEKFRNYRAEFSRLGEINWQAIEDYDRQKLRYDFLEQQEVELKTSMTDLQTAIAHIDEKSRMRFKEAYDAVNERFIKVFPIIFGGGTAKLEIVGDLDSPECGIDIIAQPPGKKMQNINLMSGGEKAMTAVSLIFSIFLVKPSPFCLLDEVDAPLDDANVGRFNELLREMSSESQFILITHNKKTMELNDTLYGVTMQEPGVSKAVSVQLQ